MTLVVTIPVRNSHVGNTSFAVSRFEFRRMLWKVVRRFPLQIVAEAKGLSMTACGPRHNASEGGRSIRLDTARRRLKETTVRIGTITGDCGFSGEEQMRLAFVRSLGIPPRDYGK